ncbi:hypothetical protein O9G_001635 [Rozella allomycis CSF55]|uniref:Homeobox domain-containing protein n=1 Tax=Rozella allomycis (strain CSF55) TaxID=988480 RepID=A0A075AXL2_ROZAC|nr:hypothetical protein O9G_001635 [Rozella allomycis CSF55]|eukprot:EPZ33284.1 hypothetical protein O9G_001635 [Rozella allomycis CSF55]
MNDEANTGALNELVRAIEKEEKNPVDREPTKRRRLTMEQLKILNNFFEHTYFPTQQQRQALGKELNLPPRSVPKQKAGTSCQTSKCKKYAFAGKRVQRE